METPDKKAGVSRNTKQKTLVLECLRGSEGLHVTADGVVDWLRENGTPVAKSTVYRCLAGLEGSGQVRKYSLGESQPACYQFVGESPACQEHFHLMCKDCSDIVHFCNEPLRELLSDMRRVEGFSVDGARTVFYGLCARCAGKGRKE